MISITLSWLVCLYLALFLAGILILWIGYEVIRKRHSIAMNRNRVFCRICCSRFTDTGTATLVKCPICGSLNERSKQEGF